jgi:catechol 2,3-dioxygenase-like lactoylglutathione lyase family enzyme
MSVLSLYFPVFRQRGFVIPLRLEVTAMGVSFQVVFDCAHPDALARFWAEVLGYKLQDPPPGFATWEDWARANGIPEDRWDAMSAVVDREGTGPRIFFQRVPESKTAKNRVHLDVNMGGGQQIPVEERQKRIDAEVERLVGLGATLLRTVNEEADEYFVNMLDPEGNEFDLQ